MRLPDSVRRVLLYLLRQDAAARGQTDTARAELEQVEPVCEFPSLPAALRGWLDEATAQMRWKRARPAAGRELADHLREQYDACCDAGLDEDVAAQQTLREMGDAVETGTRLDRAWRPRPDWVMLGIVLVLAAVGVAVQLVLRQPFCETMGRDLLHELALQCGYYALGVAALLAAYFLDYTVFGRHIRAVYALWLGVGLFLLLNPWRAMIGGRVFYAAQWVWLFPPVFAGVVYDRRGRGTGGVLTCLLSPAGMWVLACGAPMMSALLVLTVVCCAVLCLAVRRGAFGAPTVGRTVLALSPVAAMAAGAAWLLLTMPHLRDRVAVILHPQIDPQAAGWQGSMVQHLMFGAPFEGSAEGALFMQYDGVSDWLLTGAKMTWGWAAVFVLLAATVLLLAWGLRLARRQNGLLARCLCLCIMLTFAAETALYVLANCGIIVLLPQGLPLLSYGGLFRVQTMFLLGLVLSAQRSGALERGLQPRPRRVRAE